MEILFICKSQQIPLLIPFITVKKWTFPWAKKNLATSQESPVTSTLQRPLPVSVPPGDYGASIEAVAGRCCKDSENDLQMHGISIFYCRSYHLISINSAS